MNCHDTSPLLGDYVLGLLESQEREQVEQHLGTGCEACSRELVEINEALALLAEGEPLLAPTVELKRSLFDRIDAAQVTVEPSAQGESSSRSRSFLLPWIAAGLAAVAVGLGTYGGWWNDNGAGGSASAPNELAIKAWQQQIEGTNREFGLIGTTLVSLPIQETKQGIVSHLLVDEVANQLHIWTRPIDDEQGTPNWVWVLNAEGRVIGNAALADKGDRLGAVVSLDEIGLAGGCRLLLTVEADPPGAEPSEAVVDGAAFEMP